ncbi:serine/threonine protein kinase [Actinomadura barringtoniae]|uniref:Serine/threonine protein kinase n=1 Tax=Actinomadura barringtoniae TaxID=1427535 RepID=A0A939T9T7_9ACTN|nr:serine/threonine-protein kinase [Actinomadura barringtoniae]MBO2451747.1 serine/threonine protein kinase [Actinomadura barringtoniae]
MEALRPTDPRRLGEYEVEGRLGVGGQGVVYLGRTPEGTPVAIKLLHPGLTEDAEVKSRFVREAGAAQQVARFCTAQILDVNVDDDQPYVVSEYVPGPSLRHLVSEQGPITGADLERLAIGMATALTAIHRAGIVHRDFKPANVLIGPDGPRVIDFGIARALDVTATQTGGQPVGTPSYMSPEQLDGRAADPAMDVFAFAATLVFAANGTPPFGQDTIPAVVARILHRDPELGDLSGTLREAAAACLAKDPADRPTSQELLLVLLGQGPAPARTENALSMLNAGKAAAGDAGRTRAEPAATAAQAAGHASASETSPSLRDAREARNARAAVDPTGSRAAAAGAASAVAARPRAAAAHSAGPPPDLTSPRDPAGDTQAPRPRSGARKRAVILGAAVIIALLAIGIPLGIRTQDQHQPMSKASAGQPGDVPSVPADGSDPSARPTSSKSSRPAGTSSSPTPTSSSPRPTRSTPTTPGKPTGEPVYGTLETQHYGVDLGPGHWGSHSFSIRATGGPVKWTSSTSGPVSAPASGSVAADSQSEVTVTQDPDAPTTGDATLTLQGEKNTITITIHWTP